MAVPFPSNVLIVSDYEKYGFKEKIPYRIDFVLALGDNSMPALSIWMYKNSDSGRSMGL